MLLNRILQEFVLKYLLSGLPSPLKKLSGKKMGGEGGLPHQATTAV